MRRIEHVFEEMEQGRGVLYSWFAAMYSRVDIVVCGGTESDLKAVIDRVYDKIDKLEKTANFFFEHTELTQLNKALAGAESVVSEELLSMIYVAVKYNELTDGGFDICVKSDRYDGEVIKSVEIDLESRTIIKHRHGVRFDLSGFLKGYALDEARRILGRYAVSDALLSMGNSSVMAIGNHPFGLGWRVAKADGTENAGDGEVTLYNECLSTSGNSDSDRQHIVAPANRELIKGAGAVSVVTPGGAEGEALATAMFVERDVQKRKNILDRFQGARLL